MGVLAGDCEAGPGTGVFDKPVLIVGTGLLGTSIALGLRAVGVGVYLRDSSPVAVALAQDLGAGVALTDHQIDPGLVVVCVPPDVTAGCVREMLLTYPDAVVTDVASVKDVIVEELSSCDLSRYVGSHPMAGREKSGAAAADADLFAGRPWVLVPADQTSVRSLRMVRDLAVELGGVPLQLPAGEHDQAVALVSHVPQLISSLLASRLNEASAQVLSLAGQGLGDTTRIAGSDPRLWTAIISGNRVPIARILGEFKAELSELIEALESRAADGSAPGLVGTVSRVLQRGNTGRSKIPGKHGGAQRRYREVCVLVPDEPGELGRLFGEVGEVGANIEDFSLEHSSGQPVGRARLSVNPAVADDLEAQLQQRGWRVFNS